MVALPSSALLWKCPGGQRIIRLVSDRGRIQIELRTSPSPRIPPLLKRHLLHLAPVAFAFLAPFVDWWVMAGVFAAFIPFNFFVLQRLPYIGDVFRLGESYLNGVRLYPIAVCAAYAFAHSKPYVATTGFVVMAVGDACSGIVGGFFGKLKLPWNRAKTFEGFIAFFLPAWGAATYFLHLHGVEELDGWLACAQVALVAAAAGAAVESLYLLIDDNLTVVAASCAASWAAAVYFHRAHDLGLGPHTLLVAVGLNASLAGIGYALGAFTGGAAAAAFAIGGGVYAFLGPGGYGVLAAYLLFIALLRPFDKERVRRLDWLASCALLVPLAAAWARFALGDAAWLAAYAGSLAALAAGAGGRVLPRLMGKKRGTTVLAPALSSILIALASFALLRRFWLECYASAAAAGFLASFLARLKMKRPWGSVALASAGGLLAAGLYWSLNAVL